MRIIPTYKEIFRVFTRYIKIYAFIAFGIGIALCLVFGYANQLLSLPKVNVYSLFHYFSPLVFASFLLNNVLCDAILTTFLIVLPITITSIHAFYKEAITPATILDSTKKNITKYIWFAVVTLIFSTTRQFINEYIKVNHLINSNLSTLSNALMIAELLISYPLIYAAERNTSVLNAIRYFNEISKKRIMRFVWWNIKILVPSAFIIPITVMLFMFVPAIASIALRVDIANLIDAYDAANIVAILLVNTLYVWIGLTYMEEYKYSH